MTRILLAAVGDVTDAIVRVVTEAVQQEFGLTVEAAILLEDPGYAWDQERGQHGSTAILETLRHLCPDGDVKVLGLTERDLFIPMLSFVYGQAQVFGKVAVVSLARLRQEFYGLAPNPELLEKRARKEALHELGHTFGLVHCLNKDCIMALATNIRLLDLKGPKFCTGCRSLLDERVGHAEMEKEV